MSKLAQGRAGLIYFIEAVGLDLIKIGFSTNFQQRLKVLQASSPVPLTVLKTVEGSIQTEQALLSVFSKYKSHNEWFSSADTLRHFIAQLTEKQAFSPEMIFHLRTPFRLE